MLKLIAFTIFLISSPTFGLLENLFQTENSCYSGCHSTYAGRLADVNACKTGCDYKLHDEHCADQCKVLSIDEQLQASCVVGCAMNKAKRDEQSQSVILLRLRRPALIDNNPTEIFRDMLKQLNDKKNTHEKTNDLSLSNDLNTISRLTKNFPINQSPNQVHTDSFTDGNTHAVRHFLIFRHEESLTNRLGQFAHNLSNKWTDLIRQQRKVSVWILFGILFSSSAILGYMIVSICRRTPRHQNLSIRAEELIFDHTNEKEKFLPNAQYYIVEESAPIKAKLANI